MDPLSRKRGNGLYGGDGGRVVSVRCRPTVYKCESTRHSIPQIKCSPCTVILPSFSIHALRTLGISSIPNPSRAAVFSRLADWQKREWGGLAFFFESLPCQPPDTIWSIVASTPGRQTGRQAGRQRRVQTRIETLRPRALDHWHDSNPGWQRLALRLAAGTVGQVKGKEE